MRVMLVHAQYRQYGGEDAAVAAELAELPRHGFTVSSFIARNVALEAQSQPRAGLHALWSKTVYRDLSQRIAEQRPDLLHVHNLFPALSASVYAAARQQGVALVQSLHNFRLYCANGLFLRDNADCRLCSQTLLPWPALLHRCHPDGLGMSLAAAGQGLMMRRLGIQRGLVDRFLALSGFSRQQFIAAGLPEARIGVKPNFIADPGVEAVMPERRGLLYAGRLSQEKGIDTILALAEALGRSHPDTILTIAGSGPLEATMREAAGRLGNLRLLGRVDAATLSHEMRQAALLLFPSRALEHFPMALHEALAHGLPILAPARGAMADVLARGGGWLLPAEATAADWAAKIAALLAEPAWLAEAGQQARRLYEADFSATRIAEMQRAIYAEAIAAAAARRHQAVPA